MAKKSSDSHKRSSKDKSKKNRGKEFRPKHRRVKEIIFDPESRKQYLCGFSERKKQRRAFGLAMQKVKDRKARIEQRAEMKQSMEEQVKEAEERKIQFEQAATAKLIPDLEDDNDETENNQKEQQPYQEDDSTSEDENVNNKRITKIITVKKPIATNVAVYEDPKTQMQWGGDVIVTTTTNFDELGDGDEVRNEKTRQNRRKQQQQSNDIAQEYSGKVERFLRQLKGSMPAKNKKNDDSRQAKHRNGRHGAAQMPGIGGDANLKAAKKILSRTQSKAPRPIPGKKKKKQRAK
jgi:Nucleolar protein 12 (25kDa)